MYRLILALSAVATLAACSGSKGISVSASAQTSAPADASGSLDLGNGIQIERIALAAREVEVEGGSACAPVDVPVGRGLVAVRRVPQSSGGDDDVAEHDPDGDDECELRFGPFAIDLSGEDLASGGIHWMFDVEVPAGTYDELEIKINTVPRGKAGEDPVLLELAALHASIAVWGKIDGEPFLFTTPMAVEHEREGSLVVDDETGPAITFDVDPAGWFSSGDSRLDPREPTNQGEILARIRASIRIERDDDHDGDDDDA